MQKIWCALVLSVVVLISGCADEKVEKKIKQQVKTSEIRVHGGGDPSKAPVGVSYAIKNKTLVDFPAMTIGKAIDGYSYFTKREWKDTRAANGTLYVDFTGWFHGNGLAMDAVQRGVAQRGIEIKFVINGEGVFFVGMISKFEVKTDGRMYSEPINDAKSVLESIYANKEIVF